ncbi:transcriptional regulator [Actinotalea ferrariae]|nr:transcriptional regulator [Actinotalea ferrariae]
MPAAPAAAVRAHPVPARVSPGTPAHVPVPASSLVGRERDVAEVGALLDGARLVTIVGPGGVGKTRVALEVARRRAAGHASGARVVELTTLTDPGSVPAAVLAAIGVGTQGGPVEAGLRRAGELDVLVVLDNCEHVLDTVAHMLEQLLPGGRARVLATSREPVGVPGEHVRVVEPLATAGTEPAARRLFVERATAAGVLGGPGALDPDLVDRVVRRLDGLPLAIEMAAARTATLHLDELSTALEDGLDAEIELLRDPRRHGADRHRTLRAVIAWSETFLTAAERDALRRWPVFAGPVEARDAAAVVAAPRSVVEQLVRRSLLVVDPARPTGGTRYRMLRTVASAVQSGWGAPTDADRARHAAHLLAVASEADAGRRTGDEARAVRRLASVVAELRAAHAWARQHDPHLGARLSRALHTTAVMSMDDERLGWAAQLTPSLEGDRDASVAHAAVAARLLKAGELAAAEARAVLALTTAANDVDRMHALDVLTDVPLYDARFDESRRRAVELRDVALAVGDPYYVAVAGTARALCAAYEGDPAGAHAAVAACRAALARRFEDVPPSALGWLDYADGEAEVERDPARALEPLERALGAADEVGNLYLGGVARVSVASVRARHGDPVEAARTFAEVVPWWLDRGDRTHLLTTLRNLVDLLLRAGSRTAAAELWAAVEAPAASSSFGPERERLDRVRHALDADEEPDHLAEALARGRARGVEAAARAALDALGALT